MSVKVFNGGYEDIPWIIEELKKFSKFYGTKHQLYPGDELATHMLKDIVDNHILLVSANDDIETGFMAGLMAPHFFNPTIEVITEILWWVKEEYRGGRSGYMLLKEFTLTGKKVADWTILTTECKSDIGDRAINSMGYRQYEKSYILEA